MPSLPTIGVNPAPDIRAGLTPGGPHAVVTSANIQYYVNKLITQYRLKPKAMATIAILVKQAIADDMALLLANAFTVDTAVGPQLDIIGKYVGVNRNIGDPASKPYFGFKLYAGGGNTNGFTSYAGGVNTSAVWYRYAYAGTQNTNLSDAQYRFIIKLKIILNSMDGTYYSIVNFLLRFFPGQISLVDNKDMTVTYSVQNTVQLSTALLKAYLPKPMGVGITVNIVEPLDTRITSDGASRITSDGSDRVTESL